MRPAIRIDTFFVIGVTVVFSLVSIFARLAYDSGSSVLTVLAARTVLVGSALWLYLRARGQSRRLAPADRNRALALGTLLALSTFVLNKAVEIIPVSIAILIFYTYPLLTSLASWATGTERFTLRVATTLVLAFGGLALALQVQGDAIDPAGLAYAIGAAVSWGLLMYLTGRLFRGGDSRPRTLYMMLSSSLLFLLACAVTGDIALPATPVGWWGFAGVPLTYGIGIVGTMAAVSAIGAMKTSIYMNFEPVATIIFSALILGQHLTPVQLGGAALVIAALALFKLPPPKGT